MLTWTSTLHFAFKHLLSPRKVLRGRRWCCRKLIPAMLSFWRKLWGHSSQACGWGWRIPLEYHNLGMAHQYTENVKYSTCNAPQHSREYSRSHVKVKSLPVPLCVLLQVVFFSRLPTWKIALPWQHVSAWATESFKTHWKPLLISGHLIQLLCFVFNCEGFFPWPILFGDLHYCL